MIDIEKKIAEHTLKKLHKKSWNTLTLDDVIEKKNKQQKFIKSKTDLLRNLNRYVDMMLIDSLHRPDHMTKELNLHGVSVNKYIIAHDTYTIPSLQTALKIWCNENRAWKVHERGMINAGYTVLKKNA